MTTTNAELIDRLIGSKSRIGERIMGQYKTMQGVVQNIDSLPITDRQKGILRSALDFRCVSESPESINSPSDAAFRCKHLESETQEQLVVIGLDRKSNVLFQEMVYRGNAYSSIVRPCEVFRTAIIRSAVEIILVHNHPSGDATPSPDDVRLTRTIAQAGQLLEIRLVDHIVIGFGKWVSLRERGLGFS